MTSNGKFQQNEAISATTTDFVENLFPLGITLYWKPYDEHEIIEFLRNGEWTGVETEMWKQ